MIIISSKTTESSGRPDAPYEQEQFSGYNLEDLQLEKVLESQCMRRFILPLWMDWDIPGIDFILRRRATSKRPLYKISSQRAFTSTSHADNVEKPSQHNVAIETVVVFSFGSTIASTAAQTDTYLMTLLTFQRALLVQRCSTLLKTFF